MSEIILKTIDIEPLVNAKSKLDEAIFSTKDWIGKTASIQCFEYTYELSWKILKKVLFKEGRPYNSPKSVFRAAAQVSLISDPELWFTFTEKRNLATHTYNEKLADELFAFLPIFQKEVDILIKTLRALHD